MVEVGLPTAGIVSDGLLDDIEDHSTVARSSALLRRLLDDEEGE